MIALVCMAGLAWLVFRSNRMFRHETYRGSDAVAFILDHPTLSQHWLECGLSTNAAPPPDLTAARGVLQSGSRFCVSVDVDGAKWSELWGRLCTTNDTRLRDPVLDLCITGKQFTIVSARGSDGPELLGMLQSNRVNTITYYGYAGDGG